MGGHRTSANGERMVGMDSVGRGNDCHARLSSNNNRLRSECTFPCSISLCLRDWVIVSISDPVAEFSLVMWFNNVTFTDEITMRHLKYLTLVMETYGLRTCRIQSGYSDRQCLKNRWRVQLHPHLVTVSCSAEGNTSAASALNVFSQSTLDGFVIYKTSQSVQDNF